MKKLIVVCVSLVFLSFASTSFGATPAVHSITNTSGRTIKLEIGFHLDATAKRAAKRGKCVGCGCPTLLTLEGTNTEPITFSKGFCSIKSISITDGDTTTEYPVSALNRVSKNWLYNGNSLKEKS